VQYLSLVYAAVLASDLCAGYDNPSLTVIVYDYVGLKSSVLRRSELEATRILGVPVSWMHCSEIDERTPAGGLCQQALQPDALRVDVLPKTATRRGASVGSAGYAIPVGPGEFGVHCGVFYDRVQQISRQILNEGTVLGHAIAHEIGHLLLGVDAHSPEGLMRAHWTPHDLALAAQGKLLLLDVEKQKIQRNVSNRLLAVRP
jgi:hypothetical protein